MGIVRLDAKYINDLEGMDAKLRRFARELDDFEGLWRRFSNTMIEVTEEWFASQGHGSWPPLAESTVRFKEEHDFPPDPLIRSGDLLRSLTTPEAGLIEHGHSTIGTFTGKAFSWGTEVREEERPERESYAGYHQEGDGVPKRQVIEWPLSAQTEQLLEEDARDYVEEILRSIGEAP